MNRLLRTIITVAVLGLFVFPAREAKSAAALLGIDPAAKIPWKTEVVLSGVTNIQSISVEHVGSYQYPFISYVAENGYTRFLFPAVSTAGNCGGGRWYCWDNSAEYFGDPWHTSPPAIYQFTNSFKVGWIYKDSSSTNFMLREMEFTDNLQNVSSILTRVLDMDYFDDGDPAHVYEVIGRPSLAYDAFGNAHFSAVAGYGTLRKLVYGYEKTGGAPTTPCNGVSQTHFQCDLILDVNYTIYHGTRIVLKEDNKPGIAFFTVEPDGNGRLMYAYPYSSMLFPHTNCGPGGNTWRCIVMLNSAGTYDVGGIGASTFEPQFEMTVGSNQPHMAVKAENSQGAKFVLDIKYVGTGGNCGGDWSLNDFILRWQCTEHFIDSNPNYPYTHFDIAVNAEDYPLLALGHAHYLDWIHLWWTYPEEIVGGTPGIWGWKKLDGRDINTAYLLAYDLSDSGLGLIAYIEKEDWNNKLKIAYQAGFPIYLPAVTR